LWPLAVLLLFAARPSAGTPERMEIAITVDDLPAHGPLPAGTTRVGVAVDMIKALKAHGVSNVYGFVNARRLKDQPETAAVLSAWVEAGFSLGNHTYEHMDLDKTDAKVFEEDIAADEPVLSSLMGSRDWHWFRYPFVHQGDSVEKSVAVRTYLLEHGYKIAHVTLDFQSYLWNEPYARCVSEADSGAIEWLKESYLGSAMEYISMARQLANTIFHRPIKHVLLLHIGAFESVMLPALLNELTRRGARFISLPEAGADPAYESRPDATRPLNGSLLDQWVQARHLPYPPHAEKPLEKLNAACR
jgi:peptidoglycan/xylan/chitin deacetylase (PgdA/CDA1 family)